MKRPERPARARGDVPLLICVCAMACFGCVMIYSASSYIAEVQYGDSLYFVKKQSFFVYLTKTFSRMLLFHVLFLVEIMKGLLVVYFVLGGNM